MREDVGRQHEKVIVKKSSTYKSVKEFRNPDDYKVIFSFL